MKMILKQIYEMLGEECFSSSKKVDLIFEKFDSVKNELTLNEFIEGKQNKKLKKIRLKI